MTESSPTRTHPPNTPPAPPPSRGTTGTTDTAQAAGDQASRVADTASGEASRLGDQAKEGVRHVADEARHHVQGIADTAVDEVRNRADEQLQRAGSGLRQTSDQLHALARGNPDEAGPMTDYAELAASAVADWADRFERRGVTGLVGDLSDFGRRKPGQFLAGALVAGMLAGRIGRAVQAADIDMPESRTNGTSDQAGSPSTGSPSTGSPSAGSPSAGSMTHDATPREYGNGASQDATVVTAGRSPNEDRPVEWLGDTHEDRA